MCGIAGICNLKTGNANSVPEGKRKKEIIVKMTRTLIHRGPDDEGFYVDDTIALGHRRLSIIDLTQAGHQPMMSHDKNLVIVFNGEIYNYIEIREELCVKGYKFTTETDTEVILASYEEWGTKCLDHFNGMWAFVIYDRRKKTLFGSRDRLGVKPFFYNLNADYFVFASEIKAILTHPSVSKKTNDIVIWNYLTQGLLDYSEETFFQGIRELRGGHYFVLKKNQLKIQKYWDLATLHNQRQKTDREYEKEFLKLFYDSIKLRLRADVPLGTCLSGGLDSSAIVMVTNEYLKKEGKLKQIGRMQKTFTSSYKDRYSDCDERSYVKEVIQKTKATPFYIFPDGKNLACEVQKIIRHHDAPFSSTSIYAQWNVFRLAKSHRMKVMLDGQGADELLAGYLTFFPYLFAYLKKEKRFGALFQELVLYLKYHAGSSLKNFFVTFWKFPAFKNLLTEKKFDLKSIYLGIYTDKSIFNHDWFIKYKKTNFKKISDPFLNHSYNLLINDGLPALLRYEDRNSMAFSIESRTPFLDYHLVEFVYGLPANFKIRNGQTKWIMRQALKGILPEKIRTRHNKLGFATPENSWLRGDLAQEMRKVFESYSFAQRPYFNAHQVNKKFEQFLHGEPVNNQHFWRIYCLELWLRQYFD